MAGAAASVSLSAPYVVFPLSQPLHRTRAKDREGSTYRACFTSPVESTKRRKRGGASEITVAVDGEGVNIYDVCATQIISTYALPPTTKFSCAPTSSFSRAGKKAAAFSRRTYAAVSMPKKQLLCWEEQGVSSDDDKAEAINMLSRSEDSRHDVVYLQDLAVGRKRADGGLIAVYADGYVRCFSSDLKEQRWEFLAQSLGAAKKVAVVFTASTTLASAKKALLKNRLDIVLPETVSMEEEEAPEDMILFTVSHNGPIFEARVFSIPTSGDGKTPRELLVLPLPGTADETPPSFSLHFQTATLNLLSTESLTTFSLSTTMPTVLSSLRIASSSNDDPAPSSLLRISSSTVLVATNEDITLYDTKFTSLQARVPVQPSTSTSTPATSRASTPASAVKGTVALTIYLPDLDLAIGYSQNGIVAIQLSRAGLKGDARKSGLLIDSLCRGVGADRPPNLNEKRTAAAKEIVSKLTAEKDKMEGALVKLKSARKGRDLGRFESAFAKYVGVKRIPKADVTMADGATTATKALLEFCKTTTHKPLLHEFVTAVLGLIFEPSIGEGTGLKITFYPPNVVKYLAESGNLSSLRGLVGALAAYDPTLHALEWALSTVSDLSITEVIAVVRIMLNEYDPTLQTTRTKVLRLALIRLDTFPPPTIISTFKAHLSGDNLTTLITLLRGELSLDAPHSIINDMGISSSLLTSALDTLGISGLVLRDGADTFVAALHEEITEAVEAVEEAVGLKGILGEVFRHAEWRARGREVEKGKGKWKGKWKGKKRLEVRDDVPEVETPKRGVADDAATPKREVAPAVTPSRQLLMSVERLQGARKMRASRSSPEARTMRVTRLEARRRPRVKAEKKAIGPLLPLGIPPMLFGNVAEKMAKEGLLADAEKEEVPRKKWREDALRKSMVAGVYSVETMVV